MRRLVRVAKQVSYRALERLGALSGQYDVIAGRPSFHADGMSTMHAADFLTDKRFVEAYRLGEATRCWAGAQVHWRCYVCCWAAELASHLHGDFVACGVNRGGYARAICHYVDLARLDKTFWLLDTYDEHHERVVATFATFPARVVRGAIRATLPQVTAARISYLSIGMNDVEPDMDALEHFWPRLVRGGIVVSADYGFRSFAEQKKAWDAFARRQGLSVLRLPTGQGLLIKPS